MGIAVVVSQADVHESGHRFVAVAIFVRIFKQARVVDVYIRKSLIGP